MYAKKKTPHEKTTSPDTIPGRSCVGLFVRFALCRNLLLLLLLVLAVAARVILRAAVVALCVAVAAAVVSACAFLWRGRCWEGLFWGQVFLFERKGFLLGGRGSWRGESPERLFGEQFYQERAQF